jgi:hypothetical protein
MLLRSQLSSPRQWGRLVLRDNDISKWTASSGWQSRTATDLIEDGATAVRSVALVNVPRLISGRFTQLTLRLKPGARTSIYVGTGTARYGIFTLTGSGVATTTGFPDGVATISAPDPDGYFTCTVRGSWNTANVYLYLNSGSSYAGSLGNIAVSVSNTVVLQR